MANKNKRKQQRKQQRKDNMTTKKVVTPIIKPTGKDMSDAEFNALVAKHDREGGALAQAGARQAQGCWDSGIKIIQNCGHMTIPEYLIRFSQLAHEKIECLKRSYPSLEWLAYLEGKVDHETREVVVEDLIIPDSQVVTGGHVGEVEYGWNEGKQICGVIHSHNTMGAFFSGTDDAYINQNHDVSVCVSTARGREICAQVRVKTPCGSYIINSNIRFKVDYTSTLDEKAFVKEFSPKIRTPRVIFSGGRQAPTSGRGVSGANRARGGQSATNSKLPAGYSTELRPTDSIKDPFEMDEAEVRTELLRFHTEDDVQDMEKCSLCLSSELTTCYEALGYSFDDEGDLIIYEDEEFDLETYQNNCAGGDGKAADGDGWDIVELDKEDALTVAEPETTPSAQQTGGDEKEKPANIKVIQ